MIDSTVNFKSLTDMLNVLTAEGFGIELFNLNVPGGWWRIWLIFWLFVLICFGLAGADDGWRRLESGVKVIEPDAGGKKGEDCASWGWLLAGALMVVVGSLAGFDLAMIFNMIEDEWASIDGEGLQPGSGMPGLLGD